MAGTSPGGKQDKTAATRSGALLSIGDLARATDMTVGTLRMWETRYGFPVSIRTGAGHRRYDRATATQVLDVQRRRRGGMTLQAAIESSATTPAPTESVYASICRDRPEQPRYRLHKSTLAAISHAFEDEIASTATDGFLLGAFQSGEGFAKVAKRWHELARTARATMAMADFGSLPARESGSERIAFVNLRPDAPMRREWVVVNDSPGLPLALSGWEIPGQGSATDPLFETVWTVDADAVRAAARSFCSVAATAGNQQATDLLAGPLEGPPDQGPELSTVARVLARAVAYVDAK